MGQEVGVDQRACTWEEADHMHLGMVGVVEWQGQIGAMEGHGAWCVHGHPWAKGKAGPGQAHKMKAEAPAGDCQDLAQCPWDVVAR